MRRFWPLVLAVFLLLPGLPPLLKAGLEALAERAGYRLELGHARGYALWGLVLEDVRLEGPGVALSAERVRLDYQLLGLLSRRLVFRLGLEHAEADLDPAALLRGGGGGGGGLRPVLTGLSLADVRVRVRAYAPWSLPEVRLWLSGEGPYAFVARLPGGEVRGEFELEPGFALRFRAPLSAVKSWYPEVLGGELAGRLWLAGDGLRGEGEVADGRVRVAGFLVEGISGRYELFPDRLEARLEGRGLEGPVRAEAEVSWKERRYRFRVNAEPAWRAVAAHFGARLPLEGRGSLELSGEGWERLRLAGRFYGTPRLFGYALPTRGELSYEEVFKLSARAEGRFYDRDLALAFDLAGEDWTLRYRDEKKSRLVLRGKGPRAGGGGELALPEPLKGRAEIEAEIEGNRWHTRVTSENVELLGFRPFSLSGAVWGEGERVEGRLGPVTLKGRWSDLTLRLDPLPLLVGTLSGELRYKERFFGRLDYTSPYASFPIQVEGEGGRWRFLAPYGEGRYEDGAFRLRLDALPIRLGGTIVVAGEAVYQGGGWRGRFRAEGLYLEASAELLGREVRFEGALLGPYGPLGFAGGYAEGRLWLGGEGFSLSYGEGGLTYRGTLRYGPLWLSGELGYRGGFSGALAFRLPGVEGRLYGREGALWLESRGMLSLSGRVYPEPRLRGRFAGYRAGPFALLGFGVRVEGSRVLLGEGFLDLAERRLSLELPFLLYGREGVARARGDFEGGEVSLELSELGAFLRGEGPWRDLAVRGGWSRLSLLGRVDLLGLGYRGRVFFEGVKGAVAFSGRGREFRFAGRLRSGGVAELAGDAGGFRARFAGFRLDPFGVSAEATGSLGYDGEPWAELVVRGGGFEARAEGRGRVALSLSGPYLDGEGELSLAGGRFALSLSHPYLTGEVGLRYGEEGLFGEGEGRLALPGFRPARERFWLSGSRWRIEGPLRVSGEGLRWRGEARLEGALGELVGTFAGEGKRGRFTGELRLPKGRALIEAELAEAGPRVLVQAPGGRVRWEGGVLELGRFDLGALFGALGLPLAGEARGGLGEGRLLSGYLAYGAHELRFALRREGGIFWLPELDAGARLRVADGFRLVGIGALEGELILRGGRFTGALSLLRPRFWLELSGEASRPRARGGLEARGVRASFELAGQSYRGRVEVARPELEGVLELTGEGLGYRGEGRLKSKLFLRQEGPLFLEGEGARFSLEWRAPLGVTYRAGELRLNGRAPLAGGEVEGELSWRAQEGFSGAMRLLAGPVRGELEGEGPLAFRLAYPGGELVGEVSPELSLSGRGRFERSLLKSRLALDLALSGRLTRPVLTAQGALLGAGERVALALGYDGAPWLRAEGPGLWARLDGRFFELVAEGFDLGPFFGVPFALFAQGAGEYDRLRLPLALKGPWGELSGALEAASRTLALSGRLWGGEAGLLATPEEARLWLDTAAPALKGVLRWRRGEGFSGEVVGFQAVPGGRLSARLVAEEGVLELSGTGAAWGRLVLDLAGARAWGDLGYRRGGLGVRARGEGSSVGVLGEGELEPLSGELSLRPLAFSWRYEGPLPWGLGELWAGGRLPGRWLEGEARVLGKRLSLLGEGGRLEVAGEGLRLVYEGGLRLWLEEFALGPLVLSGELAGREGAFRWRGLGLAGELALRVEEGLWLALRGDLEGEVALGEGGWRGWLLGPELSLRLEPRYRARGELLGLPLELDLEERAARLGGLSLRYPWAFSGEARVRGVTLLGLGDHLEAAFLGFRLALWPSPLRVVLGHGRARGELVYAGGRFSGELAWRDWVLRGEGEALALWRGEERLGVFVPQGARLELILAGFRVAGEGGVYRVESPYGGGVVRLVGGLAGDLELKVPLGGGELELVMKDRRLRLAYAGPAGELWGEAELPVRARAVGTLRLERLGPVRAALPYLVGRVSLVLEHAEGRGVLQLGSDGLGVSEAAYPFALIVRWGGGWDAELAWAGLRAQARGARVVGEAADFPLDLPLALHFGPFEGGVRFTGCFAAGLDGSWLELAGERVRIHSPTQTLVGQVALVYRERTLELRRFAFRGDGEMQGGGVWTFGEGGDLWLRVKGADFSPLLVLDPRLARWRPEGRGDLEVSARGSRVEVSGRGRFSLAGVEGEVDELGLSYDAARRHLTLAAGGRVVRPVKSELRLWGEGPLTGLVLHARGDLEAPLLAPLPVVEVELRYPELSLSARAGEAELSGRLRPFELELTGRLPLAYPRYYLISGQARPELRLVQGEDGRFHLAGEVEVERALFSLPEERPVIEEREEKEIPLDFDQVRIYAQGGILLNNPLAQGEAAGEVYLGGSANDPYLAGRVYALWGSFLLLNHRFEVEEGWARFSPELGVYPELFLRARAETPEGPLFLVAEGRFVKRGERAELVLDTCLADRPVESLAVCKLLPQERLAARLLGLGEGPLAEQVVDAAVKNLLIGQLESELARSLGLDLFRFETGAFEGEGVAATRFTVGKYLTPGFFLAYEYALSEGSRVYASYRSGGLELWLSTGPVQDPSPEFSLAYALTEDLAFYLKLAEERFEAGLEWRP